MKRKSKYKSSKSRLRLLHQYYSYTGFYSYIWNNIKKSIPFALTVILFLYSLSQFVEINTLLSHITNSFSIFGIMFTFFISEAFLGILPPEFFIAWSATLSNQWLYLGVLSVLSYFGGLLSYVIGAMITKIPAVDTWLQSKIKSQLEKLKKWGGLLIVVGALLPLPFSISCMAAGIIKFPFKSVMIYGSLRFLRFFVYALIIFNVI